MNTYKIELELACTYFVEADSQEKAMMIAEEWFTECIPHCISCEILMKGED